MGSKDYPGVHQPANRISILSGLVFMIFVIYGFKLFSIAILNHKTFSDLALNQHLVKKEVDPKRGTIYANSTEGLFPLATTDEKFTITAIPKNIKDKDAATKLLSSISGKPENEIKDLINNNKLYIPPIIRRADKSTAQKILDAKIAGLIVIPEYVRYYPENNLASHVIGFTNYDKNGNYGVEQYYNDQLRGISGAVVAKKDNKGRFIDIINSEKNVENGASLVLTIDNNVQYIVEKELSSAIEKYGASSGQAVIVNVENGEIIALASKPDYDPNKFNEVKSEDQNKYVDPVISEVYEPGSILKPLIVSVGLESEKIKPDTEGEFSNMVVVQGYEIHTAQDKAFGKETITQILENSDNVAMVWIADQIGNDTLYEFLQKFGFGTKFSIDLSGETTGNLPDKKNWRDINRATISFGQGISATPLQIVMGYQAIGNNGKLMQPHIVKEIIRADGTKKEIEKKELRQVISSVTASEVKRMLISVVERGHGKRAKVDGYAIGGKTGTAQIPKKDGGGYEENAHVGSFAGLVPGDNPKFAMLIKLDRPTNVEFAESSAAPTFGEIAKFLLQYYQIPKTK